MMETLFELESMKTISFFLALFALGGWCKSKALPEATNDCKVIYIVSHGWHSGIWVDREDLLKKLPSLAQDIQKGKYIEIGWGDEEFYQARSVTPGMTLRAALFPSSSVLHLVGWEKEPLDYFPDHRVIKLSMSVAEYLELLEFVTATFKSGTDQDIVRTGPGLYGDSSFYRAEGSFHAFNTCNTWVAKALRRGGFSIPRMTFASEDLFFEINRIQLKKLPCETYETIQP